MHAARTLQITGRRYRAALANGLDRLVTNAELPPSRFVGTAAVPPCREQVRDALPLLFALSARLRDGSPVNAHGVASLRLLVNDGAGPCYTHIRADALTVELQRISALLETAG